MNMKLEDEIAQKAFIDDYQKLVVNLIYSSNWLSSQIKEFLKDYNLTPQQFNILRILRGQYPGSANINLLKERMLDKMCDASRMVERLRIKGLIKKKPSEKDKRNTEIIISKNGLKILDEIDKQTEFFNGLLQNLSPKEAKTINKLLDKMRG